MKLRELKFGDIVRINAPFEENTRDYCNGYHPAEIREAPFTDRFGRTAKNRMVIFVARDGNDMLYISLTSKTNATYDSRHQYRLKDNTMTKSYNPYTKTCEYDPSITSYAELDGLRCVRVHKDWDIPYTGRLAEEDRSEIRNQLSCRGINLYDEKDTRGYVRKEDRDLFEKRIAVYGYCLTEENEYKKTWRMGRELVSLTKFGCAYHHINRPKEEVQKIIASREVGIATRMKPLEVT